MRIFIGANNTDQPTHASKFVANNRNRALFLDLERWARAKESDRGECYVFVEISLPEGNKHLGSRNQIDMLVSFPDRAAACEVKSSESERVLAVELGKCVTQINGQKRWMDGILTEGGFEPGCTCFNLLLPLFGLGDITSLARRMSQHSAPHIWSIGAQPDLRNRRHNGQKPFHLTEALDDRLEGTMLGGITPARKRNLHEFFCQQLTKEGAKLLSFDDFSQAREYLKGVSPRAKIIHDRWHIRGLRKEELGRAAQILKEQGVIILIGPPEIGKSTLVRELIEDDGGDFLEVQINEMKSVRELCGTINDSLGNDPPDVLGDDALVQDISREPRMFWIREHDDTSYAVLASLLK